MGETCLSCVHWHALPRQSRPQHQRESKILALPPSEASGTVIDLSTPQQGECRERLHLITFPVPIPGGVKIEQISLYPRTAEDFPICGHYQRRSDEPASTS